LLDLVPKYFDPRAVTAVSGSREEVTELLKLPFDFIFFTGSVKVGKIVMEAAARNLTPVLLELGGQNPAFVDATANIPDAAKKIVWGATAWGGQWCTSPGYAYVHESVAEKFVEECKKAVVELYGTDPKKKFDDYSRIVSPKAVERLASLIDQRRSLQAARPTRRHAISIPPSSIPSPGTIPSWRTRSLGRFCLSSPKATSTPRFGKLKKHPKPLSGSSSAVIKRRSTTSLPAFRSVAERSIRVNIHLFIETMPLEGSETGVSAIYYGKAGFDALRTLNRFSFRLPT
jgi:aldehyde dehydrogenase (NAD+)